MELLIIIAIAYFVTSLIVNGRPKRSETEAERIARRMAVSEQDWDRERLDDLWA